MQWNPIKVDIKLGDILEVVKEDKYLGNMVTIENVTNKYITGTMCILMKEGPTHFQKYKYENKEKPT